MTTRILLALTLAVATPPAAAAQRAILLVGVGDAETGAFVEGAEVSVRGTGRRARTDVMGRARLAGLPAGQHTVEVRRVGYEPLAAPVLLASGDSTDVVMLVQAAAQALPAVAVEASSPRGGAAQLAEFEELRRDGQGRFVSLGEKGLQRDYTLESFLISNMPGMRLRQNGGLATVMLVRGLACQPLVYLDGVMLADGDVSNLRPASLGAVAFFETGQIPPRYRKGGSGGVGSTPLGGRAARRGGEGDKATARGGDAGCGALLFWSR